MGNGLLRVARFTGGQADHLYAQVGEHHHLQRHQHPGHAIGHETAVAPQVGNAHCHAVVAEAKGNDADTAENHGNNGDDLDQGKPELELTEGLDRDQVDRPHAAQRRQGPDPARYVGEPDAHVNGHRGDLCDASHQPQEPVVPAGQEARQRAEVVLSVTAEGACDRVVHGHFTEGAHDHQDRQTTDDVGQHDGWSGHFDGLGRTQEQADTDTGAQRHQANMSLAEFSLEWAALGGLTMRRMVADWHRNTTSFCYWI
ncbi:hypothetical protein D3C78_659820 [compost metagenome]